VTVSLHPGPWLLLTGLGETSCQRVTKPVTCGPGMLGGDRGEQGGSVEQDQSQALVLTPWSGREASSIVGTVTCLWPPFCQALSARSPTYYVLFTAGETEAGQIALPGVCQLASAGDWTPSPLL
jgi:hypothetical protein